MAGSIENRLRRLEGDQPKRPCPGCGDDGDPSKARFEVVWGDEDRGDPGEPMTEEGWRAFEAEEEDGRCPACERRPTNVTTIGSPPPASP